MSDVLLQLKATLAIEQQKLDAARAAIHEIKLAFAAIEDCRAGVEATAIPQVRTTRRHGALKRSVVDCIRNGCGTVAEIHSALIERGLNTSRHSISNAITRLQHAKVIHSFPPDKTGRWVIREETYPRDDDDDHNDKGSADEAEPLQWNGAAGSHPA